MRRIGTLAGIIALAGMGLGISPVHADEAIPASTSIAYLHKVLSAATPASTVTLGAGTFSISKPLKVPANVTLTGSGTSSTVLKLASDSWSNFSYGFLVMPAGDGSTVSNLTVDGNRSSNPTPTTNVGGGIKVANNWTVTAVRFTNLNYFKLWVHQVKNVTVSNCTFDAIGGTSGNEDNIGGGRTDNVTITNNTFDASTRGNAIDLLRSTNLTISNNTLAAAPGLERGIYIEGVQGATVSGNTITNGSISAKTDKSYTGTDPITNPANITITGNRITSAVSQGIGIVYDTDSRGMVTGGGNQVSNNVINGSGRSGIVIIHCAANVTTSSDRITGNTVTNAFGKGGTSWGTGCGTVQASGISVTAGKDTLIDSNTVIDTRTPLVSTYGVWAGSKNNRAPLVSPVITNTTVSAGMKAFGVQA